MTRIRQRGEAVRYFILNNIEKHPSDVSSLAAEKFDVTRQAVNKHIQRLVNEGALLPDGRTKGRNYRLAPLLEWQQWYEITPQLAEDVVWTQDIVPLLRSLPENVLDIWHYCFTEMFNNALDHSGGTEVFIRIAKTAANTQMQLGDNGMGIFNKIKTALNLLDERHAILELSKGKLTTDPAKHTGQGIFFTSRLVDSFDILSGGVYFSHVFQEEEDWIMERPQFLSGTAIFLKVDNHTSRTCKKVFDKFSSDDNFGFNKTVVPVKLAQYGDDKLISRSQAKRVLARVEVFRTVLFDFNGVDTIGQAFADEIFRVFAQSHPEISLLPIKANSNVKRVIAMAKSEPLYGLTPELPFTQP